MGQIIPLTPDRFRAMPSNVTVFRRPGLPATSTFGQLFDDDGYEICTGVVHRHERNGRITVLAMAGYEIEGDPDNFRPDDASSGEAA